MKQLSKLLVISLCTANLYATDYDAALEWFKDIKARRVARINRNEIKQLRSEIAKEKISLQDDLDYVNQHCINWTDRFLLEYWEVIIAPKQEELKTKEHRLAALEQQQQSR